MGTHKPQPPHMCLCLHLGNKMLETANHFAWLPFVTNRRLGFSTTPGYKNNSFGLKDQYPCGIYTRPCSCRESVIGSPGDSGSDDSCFGPLSVGSQSHEPLSRLPSYFFQPEQPPWMMLYESTVLLTLQILILQGIQEIAEPAHI
jgi:hypothetical protein